MEETRSETNKFTLSSSIEVLSQAFGGNSMKRKKLNYVKITTDIKIYFNTRFISILAGCEDKSSIILSRDSDKTKESLVKLYPSLHCEEHFENEMDQITKNTLMNYNINWETQSSSEWYTMMCKHFNLNIIDNNCIVAFEEEPLCALLAAFRAIEERRPFILISSSEVHNGFVAVTTRVPRPSSIFIFTEVLNQNKHNWIHSQLSAYPADNTIGTSPIPYGFLSGTHFEIMTFVDLKQRYIIEESDKDVVVLPSIESPIVHNNKDALILNRQESSYKSIEDVNARIFSLTSHGRSDLAFIGQDYLCGKSDWISEFNDQRRGKWPMCMKPPYQCLRTDGYGLRINELRAKHIFINSCGSMALDDSEFGSLFNMSYSAFEGVTESFIGSVRWKDGDINESFLYFYLLRGGYSLGEVVVCLNLALSYSRFERQNDIFLLVGDPSYCINSAIKPIDKQPSLIINDSGGPFSLKAQFTQVLFTNKEYLQAWYEGKLLISTEATENIYCAAYPLHNENSSGMLITLLAPYAGDFPIQISLSLRREAPIEFTKALESYRSTCEQLHPALGMKRFYPQKVTKGIKDDMDNQMINLSSLYKSMYTNPNKVSKLVTQSNKFLEKIKNADFLTCLHLQDTFSRKNFRFSEHYQDKFIILDEETPVHRCYICGKQVVIRQQKAIAVENSYRNEKVCFECGGIEDQPDSDINMEIWGGSVVKHHEVVVTLIIKNNSMQERIGYGCISLRNSSRWNLNIEPKAALIKINPLSRAAVTFVISAGETPPHKHSLQAAFVVNQKVYLGMRPFRVNLDEEVMENT